MSTSTATARTVVQPPKPPTLAEIQTMMPGLKLYNPSDEWVQLNVHGITNRWIPPDLGGVIMPHPATNEPTVCDGLYDVRGRFLTQKDSSGKTIEGQDAFAVVSYLVSRDRYGDMGVVYMPGRDATEDESLKQFAREQYLRFQMSLDDKVIERRREFKHNWEKNPAHQGQPCPQPTPRELNAIERAQEREHKKTYQYECDVHECVGYATNDFPKFSRHMSAAHKVVVERSRDGELVMKNIAGDTLRSGKAKATSGVSKPISDTEAANDRDGIVAAGNALARRQGSPPRGKGRT